MIDTKKEAEEYYEHNPQDREPIYIVLLTSDQKKEIEDSFGDLCVLETEDNPYPIEEITMNDNRITEQLTGWEERIQAALDGIQANDPLIVQFGNVCRWLEDTFSLGEFDEVTIIYLTKNYVKYFGTKALKGFVSYVQWSTSKEIPIDAIVETVTHDLALVTDPQAHVPGCCVPKTEGYDEHYMSDTWLIFSDKDKDGKLYYNEDTPGYTAWIKMKSIKKYRNWVKRLGQAHLWDLDLEIPHSTLCGMPMLGNNYTDRIPEKQWKKCDKCYAKKEK